VKICAFSNSEVLSTSSSCSCTGYVEAVLTKWDPFLDLQSKTLPCIFESTDQLMIPLFLEMDEGKKVIMLEHIVGRNTPDVPGDLH